MSFCDSGCGRGEVVVHFSGVVYAREDGAVPILRSRKKNEMFILHLTRHSVSGFGVFDMQVMPHD